jgi:hypothetical protein
MHKRSCGQFEGKLVDHLIGIGLHIDTIRTCYKRWTRREQGLALPTVNTYSYAFPGVFSLTPLLGMGLVATQKAATDNRPESDIFGVRLQESRQWKERAIYQIIHLT